MTNRGALGPPRPVWIHLEDLPPSRSFLPPLCDLLPLPSPSLLLRPCSVAPTSNSEAPLRCRFWTRLGTWGCTQGWD